MCGIFGIFDHPEASYKTCLALQSLQHRGQESAGIFSVDGSNFFSKKGNGLVTENFNEADLKKLKGNHSIGHVRYMTAGNNDVVNAQPTSFKYIGGQIALAHNGNLVNAYQLKDKLVRKGAIFQTDSDTEVLSHMIAQSGFSIQKALRSIMTQIEGAYSLIFLTEDHLFAVRDPLGFRPLSIGKVDNSWCVASETCAFDVIGAEFIHDVHPGEMVIINRKGKNVERCFLPGKRKFCSFEYIYFARPDSDLNKLNVHLARLRIGKQLAKESKNEADIVVGVPDSGLSPALGYSRESGVIYEKGLLRNRYVGRTFIQPTQTMRETSVRMKFNAVKQVICGKDVILVDDSIVRGTTIRRLIIILRDAGAKSVHVKISSPPIGYSCHYGINTSKRKELIFLHKKTEDLCEFIGADSLYFISLEGMLEALKTDGSGNQDGLCTSCFTGNYPTKIYEQL